jgi:spore maturation protein CgeB
VEALFGSGFPTWTDAPTLIDLVEGLLADGASPAAGTRSQQAAVLTEHTYRRRAATIRASLLRWASATRYGIRVGVPKWESREHWGDYHFARAIQRALERSGRPTRVHMLPDWASRVAAREDVTIHLYGLKEAPTRRGQTNLLWQISHPDLASPTSYDRYDRVFVASDQFAAKMAALCRVEVTALHQATDPERFRPDPTGPRHELLLVANSRSVRRPIVDDLAGTSHELAVYGRDWTADLIDPRHVVGEHIPNDELHRYYSSAAIVLNDHWEDMRTEGFISNRLYDALACAAFVISDDVAGVDEEFDRAVVIYRTREHLSELVERYLTDPAERRRLAEVGRAAVLNRHTFAARAAVLVEAAERIAAARPSRVRT